MATRTITLTDQPPVRIDESAWLVIAQATGDNWTDYDMGDSHEKAVEEGKVDCYTITIRMHTDGRALVYAVRDAAHFNREQSHRGGELTGPFTSTADLPPIIRRVAKEVGLSDWMVRECIAALPPIDLE